jgi:hypothetical protein
MSNSGDVSDDNVAKQQSSVRHLQTLYTLVAGLALTEAVTALADEVDVGYPSARTLSMMTAFLATLIPFFHGALRHLDDIYIVSRPPGAMHRFALLSDFVLLFLESAILLGMARRLEDPIVFLGFLIALLLLDIIWSILTQVLTYGRSWWRIVSQCAPWRPCPDDALVRWVRNNLTFVPIALIIWGVERRWSLDELALAGIVLVVAVTRTFRDYKSSWGFYFPAHAAPKESRAEAGAEVMMISE